jgi:IclR family mhp operon transcriptional activator
MSENVRSIERAIEVMRELQTLESASLAQLQARTGLPKATLSRILQTLEKTRTVWRAKGDGLWRPAFEFKPSRIHTAQHQALVEAAVPVMENLRRLVIWPSDLAVRDGAHMRLLETTRRSSGLALKRDTIGHRIDMLQSAVGRAYISNCAEREIESLKNLIVRRKKSALDLDEFAFNNAINDAQQAFHRHGYSTRSREYGGHDAPIQEFDDQLSAIAVPVLKGGRILGCINIVWLRRFETTTALARRNLGHLKFAANAIAEKLSE